VAQHLQRRAKEVPARPGRLGRRPPRAPRHKTFSEAGRRRIVPRQAAASGAHAGHGCQQISAQLR
jgi:hypothetical protein